MHTAHCTSLLYYNIYICYNTNKCFESIREQISHWWNDTLKTQVVYDEYSLSSDKIITILTYILFKLFLFLIPCLVVLVILDNSIQILGEKNKFLCIPNTCTFICTCNMQNNFHFNITNWNIYSIAWYLSADILMKVFYGWYSIVTI